VHGGGRPLGTNAKSVMKKDGNGPRGRTHVGRMLSAPTVTRTRAFGPVVHDACISNAVRFAMEIDASTMESTVIEERPQGGSF
jgi:hypothetical protein